MTMRTRDIKEYHVYGGRSKPRGVLSHRRVLRISGGRVVWEPFDVATESDESSDMKLSSFAAWADFCTSRNTALEYFEIILRADQAAALVKVLSDGTLLLCRFGNVVTEQEAQTLVGLRSQLNVELIDHPQAVVGGGMRGISSPFELQTDMEPREAPQEASDVAMEQGDDDNGSE